MKKIILTIPCPQRQDLSTIREKTADTMRLLSRSTAPARRKVGVCLVKLGLQLARQK